MLILQKSQFFLIFLTSAYLILPGLLTSQNEEKLTPINLDQALARNDDPYKTRSWDWSYKESWREDKDVFYSGGTQTEAMQRDFRHVRPPGIGDPDDFYWERHPFYARPLFDQVYNNDSDYNDYYYGPRY